MGKRRRSGSAGENSAENLKTPLLQVNPKDQGDLQKQEKTQSDGDQHKALGGFIDGSSWRAM